MKREGWRTRTKGSDGQIGSKFRLIATGKMRAKLPKVTPREIGNRIVKTPLERETLSRANKSQDAWYVGLKYTDGGIQEFAYPKSSVETYRDALKKAEFQSTRPPKDIIEIAIVDPSLKEVMHKIGAGAKRLALKTAQVTKKGIRLAQKPFVGKPAEKKYEMDPKTGKMVAVETKAQPSPARKFGAALKKEAVEMSGIARRGVTEAAYHAGAAVGTPSAMEYAYYAGKEGIPEEEALGYEPRKLSEEIREPEKPKEPEKPLSNKPFQGTPFGGTVSPLVEAEVKEQRLAEKKETPEIVKCLEDKVVHVSRRRKRVVLEFEDE